MVVLCPFYPRDMRGSRSAPVCGRFASSFGLAVGVLQRVTATVVVPVDALPLASVQRTATV